MYTEELSKGLSIADVINSQSVNNASLSSAGIDMQKFRRIMFVVQAASLGAVGTLDGRLQSCAQSNFASGVHNITNSNLVQITTSTTPGNNALASIEVRADQVATQNAGDRYVRLNLTGGGNAITVGAIGLGGEAVQKPGSANDLTNTNLSQRVIVS
jgi:hypothetical protein